ncbi:MAG TPA: NAD(P)H-binding protein [Aridibacter sp.]|nr:NAD(P)H-binding protein [Aridibacter sp.]
MFAEKTVLIIGATQGTGLEAAKLLQKEGVGIRVFVRNVPKAREVFDDTVAIIGGDLREPGHLTEAFDGAHHLIFTAGVTKRPCSEELIVSTEYEGMEKTLAAAREAGFKGRIVFLSSIGVTNPNWASRLLNKVKGNTLEWRLAMEDLIRESGFDYSIVRAGYLMNSSSRKPIFLSQSEFALELRYRIGRNEAAEVIVEALRHPEAGRKTFDAVRGRHSNGAESDWAAKFAALKEDKGTVPKLDG